MIHTENAGQELVATNVTDVQDAPQSNLETAGMTKIVLGPVMTTHCKIQQEEEDVSNVTIKCIVCSIHFFIQQSFEICKYLILMNYLLNVVSYLLLCFGRLNEINFR